MSLLHVLFYIHSAGSLELLFDTEGGAQQDRFVGGSQLIALRMAEELGERARRCSARRCAASSTAPDGVTVHADGATVRGRRAIVAIAPTLAGRIAYDPPLPGYRDQLTQRMPLGTVVKCMAIYDEPFWRADGLTGQATSDAGPVQAHLRQLAAGRLARACCSASSRAATRASSGGVGPEERRTAVIDCFARLFGPRAATPDDYVEQLWAEEEWTRGCYGCHMPTGGWTNYGPALRAPIGPLHWAGAEYAHGLERLHGRRGALGRGYGCRGSGAVDEEPDLRGDSHRRLAGTAPTEGLPRRRKTR